MLCYCHNSEGVDYLTRLRLSFSHLRHYKFIVAALKPKQRATFYSTAPVSETIQNLLKNFYSIENSILD